MIELIRIILLFFPHGTVSYPGALALIFLIVLYYVILKRHAQPVINIIEKDSVVYNSIMEIKNYLSSLHDEITNNINKRLKTLVTLDEISKLFDTDNEFNMMANTAVVIAKGLQFIDYILFGYKQAVELRDRQHYAVVLVLLYIVLAMLVEGYVVAIIGEFRALLLLVWIATLFGSIYLMPAITYRKFVAESKKHLMEIKLRESRRERILYILERGSITFIPPLEMKR